MSHGDPATSSPQPMRGEVRRQRPGLARGWTRRWTRVPSHVQRYRALPPDARALLREALRELLVAVMLVRVRGWSSYASTLGVPLPGDPHWKHLGDDDDPAAVALAVERVARLAPSVTTCLVRAVAGQRMLLRRGIASAVVLGLRTDRTGEASAPGDGTVVGAAVGAHGWLRVGERVVIGQREMPGHHPVAQFRTSPTTA